LRRERVSDHIYVFTSDYYAQVTATAVFTPDGAIVVDTLPLPGETRELLRFVRANAPQGIRYLINTHFHADHTYGSYLFTEAELITHQRCREMLVQYGQASLEKTKAQTAEFAEVILRLPEVVFDEGEAALHLGGKTLQMILTPGHTLDSTVVYVREEKILLAADTVMPVPYIVWGDPETFIESLRRIAEMPMESIVQGHGEVLLRGEIKETIKSSISYLEAISRKVREIVEAGGGPERLQQIDIESCGKSRIPLDGLVQHLHQANLQDLYARMTGTEKEIGEVI
jgi:cyclase